VLRFGPHLPLAFIFRDFGAALEPWAPISERLRRYLCFFVAYRLQLRECDGLFSTRRRPVTSALF
jgi:hypothetical protein